jgi:hypothetical protein
MTSWNRDGARQASLRVAGCPLIGTASFKRANFEPGFHVVLRLRNRMSRNCRSAMSTFREPPNQANGVSVGENNA